MPKRTEPRREDERRGEEKTQQERDKGTQPLQREGRPDRAPQEPHGPSEAV